MVKNPNCGQKSKFWSKIKIFAENWNTRRNEKLFLNQILAKKSAQFGLLDLWKTNCIKWRRAKRTANKVPRGRPKRIIIYYEAIFLFFFEYSNNIFEITFWIFFLDFFLDLKYNNIMLSSAWHPSESRGSKW